MQFYHNFGHIKFLCAIVTMLKLFKAGSSNIPWLSSLFSVAFTVFSSFLDYLKISLLNIFGLRNILFSNLSHHCINLYSFMSNRCSVFLFWRIILQQMVACSHLGYILFLTLFCDFSLLLLLQCVPRFKAHIFSGFFSLIMTFFLVESWGHYKKIWNGCNLILHVPEHLKSFICNKNG